MMEKKLFENRVIFLLYGWVNLILIAFLLILLLLIFSQIHVLSRFTFVVFVAVHLILIFFVKVHYLCVIYDESRYVLEITYNRKFGLKWLQKSRTTLVPLKKFEGYKVSSDSLGLKVITFYKKDNHQKFALGPFHVGHISKSQQALLIETLGEPLGTPPISQKD